jgi:hypothetical protein
MQAISSFNAMLGSFLEEIGMAFPGLRGIEGAKTAFETLRRANVKAPLTKYAEHMTPYMDKITSKDESFLTEDLPKQPWFDLLGKDAPQLFASAPAPTKEAIWAYLAQMTFIAAGVSAIPEEGLQMVDQLVEGFTSGTMDPMSMLQMLSSSAPSDPTEPGDAGQPMELQALMQVLGGSGAFAP